MSRKLDTNKNNTTLNKIFNNVNHANKKISKTIANTIGHILNNQIVVV